MLNRESPLRIEINPWAVDGTVMEVMQLRGAYVAAHGTIETILTELAIRDSRFNEYASIRANFPSRRAARLEYLRNVCATNGPLSPYASIICQIIQIFSAGLDLRDMFAHSRMQILSGPGEDSSVRLQDYIADGRSIKFRDERRTLSSLRSITYRATRLSRCVDSLYMRIDPIIPPVIGAFQGHESID